MTAEDMNGEIVKRKHRQRCATDPYEERGCDPTTNKRADTEMSGSQEMTRNQLLRLQDANNVLLMIHEQKLELDAIKVHSENQRERIEKLEKEANINNWLFRMFVFIVIPIALLVSINLMLKESAAIYNKFEDTENTLSSYRIELEAMKLNVLSKSTYSEELGKILHGIQWRHQWSDSKKTIHGPTFYIGLCKVRIFASFQHSTEWSDYTVNYYLERYKGKYEDITDSCLITYRHYTYIDEEYGTDSIEWWSKGDMELEVGTRYYIGSITKSRLVKVLKNNQLTFMVFFDTA